MAILLGCEANLAHGGGGLGFGAAGFAGGKHLAAGSKSARLSHHRPRQVEVAVVPLLQVAIVALKRMVV